MRKQIFASLLLLVLLLGGCAEVSTAPTSMNTEPTSETRAATEKSGENSFPFSEIPNLLYLKKIFPKDLLRFQEPRQMMK